MKKINSNDPASPCKVEEYSVHPALGNISIAKPGMTIRSQLAAMAMQGYMSYKYAGHQDPEGVAKYAVQCADALIAELNRDV